MSVVTAWRAHASGPGGREFEQATLRIVIGTLILLFILRAASGMVSSEEGMVVTVTTVYFGSAILIFAWTWIWPAATKFRRRVAMLIDVAIVTFAMFGMGSQGAFLPGVYLFLTFGNGFRFGRLDLHLCQFLCLVGFVLVGVMVPAWREHLQFFLGWLISLLVLPFYVGALSEHINQARLRAEDELKEFLARGVAK